MPKTRTSAVALLLLCAAACSSSNDGSGGGGGDTESIGDAKANPDRPPVAVPDDLLANVARPDEVQANVTWKPATKVVEDARIRSVLTSPFSNDGTYVFDGSASEIAALNAGDVVVLWGVGIFRVLSVTTEGGTIRLATEQASLEEAADEVAIKFDVASPPSTKWFDADPTSPSQVTAPSPANFGFGGALATRDFKGNIDGVEATFGVQPSAVSGDTYDFTLTGKQLEGEASGAFGVFGWATRFRIQGEVSVTGGEFQSAKIGVSDAMAEATVKIGMARLSTKKAFDFPPLLVIPFVYAGLPLFVSVGASIEFNATGKATTSILGTAKLGVRGDAAFSMDAASAKFSSELKSLDASWVGGEHVATVDVGLGAVVSFPKLSVGIGLPQLQDTVPAPVRKLLNEQWKSVGLGGVAKLQHAVLGSAYIKYTSEVVYNVSVDYDGSGGVATVKGTCADISMNGAIFYGGELGLFGKKLSKKFPLPDKIFEKQSAGKVGEPVQFGKTCKK